MYFVSPVRVAQGTGASVPHRSPPGRVPAALAGRELGGQRAWAQAEAGLMGNSLLTGRGEESVLRQAG